jgi:hypothetical protein
MARGRYLDRFSNSPSTHHVELMVNGYSTPS